MPEASGHRPGKNRLPQILITGPNTSPRPPFPWDRSFSGSGGFLVTPSGVIERGSSACVSPNRARPTPSSVELDPRTPMVPQTMSSAQPGPHPPCQPPGPSAPSATSACGRKFRDIKAEETGEGSSTSTCAPVWSGADTPVPTDLTPYYSAATTANAMAQRADSATDGVWASSNARSGPGLGRSLLDFGCGEAISSVQRTPRLGGLRHRRRSQPATPAPRPDRGGRA